MVWQRSQETPFAATPGAVNSPCTGLSGSNFTVPLAIPGPVWHAPQWLNVAPLVALSPSAQRFWNTGSVNAMECIEPCQPAAWRGWQPTHIDGSCQSSTFAALPPSTVI